MSITDRGIFAFQVLRAGGETNMHSHTHLDGFWFVRRGKARFYTGGSDTSAGFLACSNWEPMREC